MRILHRHLVRKARLLNLNSISASFAASCSGGIDIHKGTIDWNSFYYDLGQTRDPTHSDRIRMIAPDFKPSALDSSC